MNIGLPLGTGMKLEHFGASFLLAFLDFFDLELGGICLDPVGPATVFMAWSISA